MLEALRALDFSYRAHLLNRVQLDKNLIKNRVLLIDSSPNFSF